MPPLDDLTAVATMIQQSDALKQPRALCRAEKAVITKIKKSQNSTKDLIRKLTSSFDKAQKALDKENSKSEVAKELAKLERQCNSVEKSLESSDHEKAKLEAEIDELREEIRALEDAKSKAENGETTENEEESDMVSKTLTEAELERQRALNARIPTMKYAIGLYQNISNIKWDFKKSTLSDENERQHVVAGVVVDSRAGRMREFSLTNMSSYDVSNKLWDVMDL